MIHCLYWNWISMAGISINKVCIHSLPSRSYKCTLLCVDAWASLIFACMKLLKKPKYWSFPNSYCAYHLGVPRASLQGASEIAVDCEKKIHYNLRYTHKCTGWPISNCFGGSERFILTLVTLGARWGRESWLLEGIWCSWIWSHLLRTHVCAETMWDGMNVAWTQDRPFHNSERLALRMDERPAYEDT